MCATAALSAFAQAKHGALVFQALRRAPRGMSEATFSAFSFYKFLKHIFGGCSFVSVRRAEHTVFPL